MRTLARALLFLLVTITLVLAIPSPGSGQEVDRPLEEGATRWDVIDALGYGGLGFGLGLAATWDLEGSDFGPPGEAPAIIGATTVMGVVGGAVLGRRARSAVTGSRSVGPAHRAAVLGGAVLAGGTLGALAAVPVINREGEGTFLGSDEQTVTVLVLVGSAIGAAFAWRRHGELSRGEVSIGPTVDPDRGYGLHLHVGF